MCARNPALLSIGDQVRPGVYRFHSAFDHVINFERAGRLLSVVDESIGPGPLNIVLRLINTPLQQGVNESAPQETGAFLERFRLTSRPSLEIGPHAILLAGHRFRFTPRHRYDSTFVFKPTNLGRFQHNLQTFGQILKTISPPKSLAFLLDETRLADFRTKSERAFAAHITRSAHRVFHGCLLEGIRNLKGCGPGLTPSGDDFIAGLLIGLHLLSQIESARGLAQSRTLRAFGSRRIRAKRLGLRQSSGALAKGLAFAFEAPLAGEPGAGSRSLQALADAIFQVARGRNLFSNTFLDLARRGLLFGRVKDLLLALATGSDESIRYAMQQLLALGANSGADLATGLFMTVSLERFRCRMD